MSFVLHSAVLLLSALAFVGGERPASAAPESTNGWTTSATASRPSALPGQSVVLSVTVSAATARSGLIDIEVSSPSSLVAQRFFDGQSFAAGQRRTYTLSYLVPAGAATGTYTARVGIFGRGWGSLQHWNNAAATFSVAAPAPGTTVPPTTLPPTTTTTLPPTTTTTRPPTTTTTLPPTTTTTLPPTTTTTLPPTTTTQPPSSARFVTLPPGSALPTEAECAARVRPATEIRPSNAAANARTGTAPHPAMPRVTGNFTGTTDEILQWVACKWGIDEDIVRAQIAKESWWHQHSGGDYTTDQNACHPALRTSDGTACPESYGLGQVRYPYHGPAMDNSIRSTAYNVDYTYAAWRACFEGDQTWLNQFERGKDYAAGDVWGCVGLWFSGRWYTQPANEYIAAVRSYLDQRVWTTPGFIAA